MNYTTKRAVYGVHFCGNEASDYAKENGYLDYSAFAKSFDAVLNNEIMQTLEAAGYYFEPIQDGTPDHTDEIEELKDQADELETEADEAEEAGNETRAEELREQAEQKRQEAEDLEDEETPPEIFQFYIVDDNGAQLIQDYTDDPLFYCSAVDMYIWGVTHYGTAWTHVLTDIRLNAGEEA